MQQNQGFPSKSKYEPAHKILEFIYQHAGHKQSTERVTHIKGRLLQ